MGLNLIPEEKKQRLSHGLAGVVLLVKAYDKLDHGHSGASAIIGFCGLLFLAYAALHPRLHHWRHQRHFDTAAFLAEGLVMATISYTYFHQGKHALPWCYALVAVMYLGLAWRQHRRNQRDTAAKLH